jgi:hypothetical protein
MELLKLLFFTTFILLFGSLFDAILIYLFLIITYKTNITYNNNFNFTDSIINLINIIMHFIIYQFNIFIIMLNKTKYGFLITSSYNYLDSKIVKIKKNIFSWFILQPTKFIIGKIIKHISFQDSLYKLDSSSITSKVKLETNTDIYNFLDKLLD